MSWNSPEMAQLFQLYQQADQQAAHYGQRMAALQTEIERRVLINRFHPYQRAGVPAADQQAELPQVILPLAEELNAAYAAINNGPPAHPPADPVVSTVNASRMASYAVELTSLATSIMQRARQEIRGAMAAIEPMEIPDPFVGQQHNQPAEQAAVAPPIGDDNVADPVNNVARALPNPPNNEAAGDDNSDSEDDADVEGAPVRNRRNGDNNDEEVEPPQEPQPVLSLSLHYNENTKSVIHSSNGFNIRFVENRGRLVVAQVARSSVPIPVDPSIHHIMVPYDRAEAMESNRAYAPPAPKPPCFLPCPNLQRRLVALQRFRPRSRSVEDIHRLQQAAPIPTPPVLRRQPPY